MLSSHSPLVLSGLAMLTLSAIVVACGGATTSGISGPGADGGNGGTDGGTGADGSSPSGCPDTMPTAGTQCDKPGASCEYGGQGPLLLCSTLAQCVTRDGPTGSWTVTPPAATCISTPAQNPSSCPKAFGDVPTGAKCPGGNALGAASCVYPEGMCGCESCYEPSDGSLGNQNQEWKCDPYPMPGDGCPSPRPEIGSACPKEGQSCFYGGGCGTPIPFSAIACQNGAWTPEAVGLDCAILTCGK